MLAQCHGELTDIALFLLGDKANEVKDNPELHQAVMTVFRHYEKVKEDEEKLTGKQLKNIRKIKKYQTEEEKREKFEWESLVFFFESDKELKTHIEDNWRKVPFMTDLFLFLDEANFSESEQLQERSRKVVWMVNEHLNLCEGKGWFTQFRHILYEFERFFMEEKNLNYMVLEKLAHYFYVMNDVPHS